MSTHLMPTYRRLPLRFTRGQGPWLWDDQGNRYFDAISGLAVCGLGHAHPVISRVIADQAATLLHTTNMYHIAYQEQLADKLAGLSGMKNMFFGNSGAEANEAAIKIARMYGGQLGHALPTIVVMENSFHGRTMATLTATGNAKIQAGFAPLVQGFTRVPLNDLQAIEKLASENPQIVAVLLEPIQGEGGIRVAEADYLRGLRKLCDKHGWLLMLDEIQSGMGRSGRWFAHQHAGIKPDIMTLAKGLGNGIPIGVCIADNRAADVLQAGNHGTTFGGNPLSCRVGLTVLEEMEKAAVVDNARVLGDKLAAILRSELGDAATIRGKGLMIGIDLGRPCAELVQACINEGLLINVTADSVVRLLPPLIIDEQDLEFLTGRLINVIKTFLET